MGMGVMGSSGLYPNHLHQPAMAGDYDDDDDGDVDDSSYKLKIATDKHFSFIELISLLLGFLC